WKRLSIRSAKRTLKLVGILRPAAHATSRSLDNKCLGCWYAVQSLVREETHETLAVSRCRRRGFDNGRRRPGARRQDRLHPADDWSAAIDRQARSRRRQAPHDPAWRHPRRQEGRT